MPRVTLIRHGETAWNIERRYQGSSDVPLNERGRQQAEALRPRLEHLRYDAVYCSDLKRAVETAALAGVIAERITSEPLMREIDFGIFEGLTFEEARQKYPAEMDSWEADRDQDPTPHGGESLSRVVSRVQSFLNDLLVRHADQHVLVFAHGGTIAILMCLALQMDPARWWQFRLENVAMVEMELYGEAAVLLRFNDVCHLSTITA